jgi:L-histidine Nalpha-methyltransferase
MKVTQLRSDGSENARFRWITVRGAEELVDDGRDIIQGLSQSQKTIPSR